MSLVWLVMNHSTGNSPLTIYIQYFVDRPNRCSEKKKNTVCTFDNNFQPRIWLKTKFQDLIHSATYNISFFSLSLHKHVLFCSDLGTK